MMKSKYNLIFSESGKKPPKLDVLKASGKAYSDRS